MGLLKCLTLARFPPLADWFLQYCALDLCNFACLEAIGSGSLIVCPVRRAAIKKLRSLDIGFLLDKFSETTEPQVSINHLSTLA